MNSLRFAHVALNCRNQAVTEAFYSKHFGFHRARVVEVGSQPGEEQIIFLKLGEMYLELFRAKGESPVPPPSNDGYSWAGVRHMAFQVDDIDMVLQELGADASISCGPFAFDAFISGWRTVWVKDPDGNIVEISQGFVDEPLVLPAPAAHGKLAAGAPSPAPAGRI
jgi:glyoxylase I family protein